MKTKFVILLSILLLFVAFGIFIKALGSSDITENVEKKGYCKITHGEEYYYDEANSICRYNTEKINFTEREFRDVCPKNKLISTRFYSKCFFKGDAF